MKLHAALVAALLLFCTWLPAMAQEAGVSAPVSVATVPTATQADRRMTSEADQNRQKLAASLSDYLVAFSPRHDTDTWRLGFPLTSFAAASIHLAYDPANRQMMAQWKLGSVSLLGQKFQYQSYMDGRGSLNFVLSAKF